MEKETTPNPMPSGVQMLQALQSKHMYGGTVDPVTIAERRAKNKKARKQRKVNQRRSK